MNCERELRDRRIAYALLRVFLGVNIALHGVSRLAAGSSVFRGQMEGQFAHSFLPHLAVVIFATALPWCEAVLGVLILFGALTRLALIGGALIMILLTFGSGVLQDWQAAGTQLIYAIAYMLLLFLLGYNQWSVDALVRRPTAAGDS